MLIRFNLQSAAMRATLLFISSALLLFLLKIVLSELIIDTLSDNRFNIDKSILSFAAENLPISSKLLIQLAEAEMALTEPNYESAEKYVLQAINLSPNNYNYRLLLRKIRESRGDTLGAELALRDALKLAPNNHQVHWQMANLLIRQGKLDESLEYFHFAVNLNPVLLPTTLDLIWRVSDQNISILRSVVGDNPKARLKLALFLSDNSRVKEAADVFQDIDKDISLSSPETSTLFDSIIKKGFPKLANDLWIQLNSPDPADSVPLIVWNGDFENKSSPLLPQFNWKIEKSKYAQIGISSNKGHSGTHSLLIDFTGLDTTRLDNEIKHMVVLRPGVNYRLEYLVATEKLDTPEGPRVAVSDEAGKLIAQSDPVSPGANSWERMAMTFTAPQKSAGDGAIMFISIKRKPRYDYDKPTKGRIWFDDFVITEGNDKR